jgi:hypothetical protein
MEAHRLVSEAPSLTMAMVKKWGLSVAIILLASAELRLFVVR